MIENMDFFLFIKLLKAFNFLTNIFEFSKNKMLFRDILVQNHFYIENKIFSEITNENLKQKALAVYNNLKSQGFSFISVFSTDFPEELKEYPECPVILITKGNKEILKDKNINKVFFYSSNLEYIKSNRNIFEILKYTLLKENVISLSISKQEDFIQKIKASSNAEDIKNKMSVIFKEEDIFSLNYTEKETKAKNSLYIYIPSNTNSFKYKELVSASISDKLFVLNASFEKEAQELVSIFLDMGKEIITIPGNISDLKFSFSNYILRDGATMVLNKKDIDMIFTQKF